MQFPESWLREFCDPPLSTAQLAELLTMSGMEVEELRPAAPAFTGVVVGEIVECGPHPGADKLRVCRVQAGSHSRDGALQVVCGAPNARVGLRAPLALVGASLPPGADGRRLDIAVGVLRGVESHGMLCSARELGLSDDHAGLLELPADAEVGADIRQTLALDDTLFTLKRRSPARRCARRRSRRWLRRCPTNCRCRSKPPTCAAASRAASCAASTRAPRRHCGWCSGCSVAASARSTRWSTSRTT